METKECSKCKKVFPIEMYHNNKRTKDGYSYYCKRCLKEYSQRYRKYTEGEVEERKEIRDKIKKEQSEFNKNVRKFEKKMYWQLYYEQHKEEIAEYKRQYRIRNATEEKAREAARAALECGIIKKRNKCKQCGSTENLQMHHPDYTKPLLIKWLCKSCHMTLHRSKNKAA